MSIRTARVAEEIQKVISERLIRGLRDPLPGFVTVRGVEVTSDFTHAKIWVSVFGSDAQKEGAIDGLNHQKGALRYEVGQKIRLRNTPQLFFVLDESSERAARVHALLDEVKQHDKAILKQQRATAAAAAVETPTEPATTTPTPAMGATTDVAAEVAASVVAKVIAKVAGPAAAAVTPAPAVVVATPAPAKKATPAKKAAKKAAKRAKKEMRDA